MTRAEMLAELRDVLDDASSLGDPFWTDTRLLAYLAEGQDKFCELTGFFVDRTNYTVTLATGTESYALNDRVLEVLDVWDGARKLGKFTEASRGESATAWFPFTTHVQTGPPQAWQTDRETGKISFFPVPTAAENGTVLTLRVHRSSRYALDASGKEPEIPARFHRACIEWAAYKGLNHHDAEKQNKLKATEHLNFFQMYVSDGRTYFNRLHGHEVRIGTSPAYRT